MDSNELHRRIAGLLREGSPGGSPPVATHGPSLSQPPAPDALQIIPLPAVGRGAAPHESFPGQVQATELGDYYRVEQEVRELLPGARSVLQRLNEALASAEGGGEAHPELQALSRIAIEELLFLDLETAGLSAAPLFLIGALRCSEGELVVQQFLARDYTEEVAALLDFTQGLNNTRALVTFNGKSFDVPYLRDRLTYYRLPLSPLPLHVDVLHHARRRWRGRFPDCKLQTLERHLCHRGRVGDVPGEQIPDLYHDFVATQDASLLAPVLHHNWLDLVTLAELLVLLLGPDSQ